MNANSFVRLCALIFLATAMALPAIAQISVEKAVSIDQSLQNFKAEYDKLPENVKEVMDTPPRIAHLAEVWHRVGMRLADPAFVARSQKSRGSQAAPTGALSGSLVPVSNPSIASELGYSALGGFTESESSSARCGNNIVVGFNDSGSIFETPYFLSGSGSESLSGYAYSNDGGKTFHDGGPLDPGTDTGWLLAGDPVVTCGDANTFHFSQIFYNFSLYPPIAAVALSTSTDGGKTFGPPVTAVSKLGGVTQGTHFLDKSWSAVDPSNPKNIYVSYTDFDSTLLNPCAPTSRTAIEFVVSHDGGNTWSAPIVAQQACGSKFLQNSQLGLDSTGTLYISWIDLGSNYPLGPRYIELESYSKGAFSSLATVASVNPPGDGTVLQGEFREGNTDMSMAVDHSLTDGYLVFTWAGGNNKTAYDPLAAQGFYAYSDIFLTFAPCVSCFGSYPTIKVNTDTQPRFGRGHDHFQPSIAIDDSTPGYPTWAVCWYDRRADSQNFAVGRYCAKDTQGPNLAFTEMNTGAVPFTPAHGNDEFINPVYMGDYDAMSADFLNQSPGFFSSFQEQGNRGDPNIVGFRF